MSIFFYLLILILILNNISSLYLDECSDIFDCFNCTLSPGCEWTNKTCINSTNQIINSTLFSTNNSTILYHDIILLRNLCFNSKAPFLPEDNYNYEQISNKYCGENFITLPNNKLYKGIEIKLKNNYNSYGTPNILCEYILTHGKSRIDADIYINRTLSKNFLLFYSDDMQQNVQINYSTTLSMYELAINSVSFLYYSNQSFETAPFIIYIKEDPDVDEEESPLLTYSFLAAIILFIIISVGGIIIIRKCSILFNLKKKEKLKDKENIVGNKGNLSVIIEKNNVEENSRNDIEPDIHELSQIKSKKDESIKNNNQSIN